MESNKVSVIFTVLNEAHSVGRLMDSLAAQSRRPDQVVICDGGSSDGTVDVIRWKVTQYADRLGDVDIITVPGANISRGRNEAIRRAQGPIIVATDAGVVLDSHWLERITAPWSKSASASAIHSASVSRNATLSPVAVAGFFVPECHTTFETAMAATVLPLADDIEPDTFLPSSRSVAFLKWAWAEVGGYPEWLDYCEDLLFDFAMRDLSIAQGRSIVWQPDAIVHFRPRTSLRAFWRQYYRYARGDGKANLWRKRHAIRYATYFIALPILLLLALKGGITRVMAVGALGVGTVAYCRRPWQRLSVLSAELDNSEFGRALVLVPLIRLVGDLAKMTGYPIGLTWRWRNRHRPEVHWRKGAEH